jgi:molybdopterin synthase sulfur carrier subunit
MPLTFVMPGALREFSNGRAEVRLDAAASTAAGALRALWTACPGARDRVMTEQGEIRQHINVFVDGVNIRFAGGLDAPVPDGAEIIILPAVSGG